MVDSLTLNSRPPTLSVLPEWSLPDTYFFPKAHRSLLVLRNLDSASLLHLGVILNRETTNKKHRNAKNRALLSRPQEGHVFIVWELKQQLPCSTSAGNMQAGHLEFFTTLCKSVNISESTLSIDLQVADPSQLAGETANNGMREWRELAVLSPSRTQHSCPRWSLHFPLPGWTLLRNLSAWASDFPRPPYTLHSLGLDLQVLAVKFSSLYLPSSFSLNNTLTSCHIINVSSSVKLLNLSSVHLPNFWYGLMVLALPNLWDFLEDHVR